MMTPRSLRPVLAVTLLGALALSACKTSEAAVESPGPQRIDVAVTGDGFVPARTRVKVGQPVTLVVTRTVDKTCATEIVIKDYGISKPLPKGTPVEVSFTPTRAGKVHYACAMDMIAGDLVAE